MATCKKCGKTIEDGMDYCVECSTKLEADESYLDSLLSSVSQNIEPPVRREVRKPRTSEPVAQRIRVKKKISTENYNILSDNDDDDFLDNLFDSADIPEFPAEIAEFDAVTETADRDEENGAEPDLLLEEGREPEYDIPEEPVFDAVPETETAEEQPLDADLTVSEIPSVEDELTVSEIPSVEDELPPEEVETAAAEPLEENAQAEDEMSEEDSLLADLLDSVGDDADRPEPAEDPIAALDEAFKMAGEENSEDIDFFNSNAAPEDIEAAMSIPETPEPESEAPEAPVEEAAVEAPAPEAPASEDGEPPLIPAEIPMDDIDTSRKKTKVQVVEEEAAGDGGDEDILEFWNSINGDAPDGEPMANVVQDRPVGVDEGNDQDELASLLAGLPGVGDEPEAGGVGEVEAPVEEAPKKKKKGFFARIFGNVKEELTEEELEARKQAALDKLDRDEEKAEKDKVDKAEAKKAKAEAAAEAKKAKAEAAAEAKKKKEEEKKEKADKKAQLRKALVEEIEENEGKINKVGASLVFLVFGAALAFVAIGTSIYTYRIAIERAQKDFNDDKYEEAYNDIYGIDVKSEDQTLYDQIMVVNYVNTQLLAYLRYSGLEMDSEALDSLLKGLKRYEKYIFYAKELDVDEDFDFLKGEILNALSTRFGLSEEQAYTIINSETQELYSRAVRDVVDNMNQ